MIIIIIGPPGSGKSTQARMLGKEIGIPSISMGQILRDAEEAKTVLGTEAAKFTKEGKLIPSKLIKAFTRFRLEENDCKDGFILDGAPRRVEEAVVLDEYLSRKGEQIDKVISLEVSDGEVIERLLARAKLPEEEGGGREDDNIEDIKVRLREFYDNYDAIKVYYDQKDVLVRIDGSGAIEDIHKRMRALFKL
ncbi:nucleoside monophosphate kinase [Candidatus Dojkabacteria bacterium]|nr:nucleoside monophosphate kinase [Candidatus Dojkabacteria bacterium]